MTRRRSWRYNRPSPRPTAEPAIRGSKHHGQCPGHSCPSPKHFGAAWILGRRFRPRCHSLSPIPTPRAHSLAWRLPTGGSRPCDFNTQWAHRVVRRRRRPPATAGSGSASLSGATLRRQRVARFCASATNDNNNLRANPARSGASATPATQCRPRRRRWSRARPRTGGSGLTCAARAGTRDLSAGDIVGGRVGAIARSDASADAGLPDRGAGERDLRLFIKYTQWPPQGQQSWTAGWLPWLAAVAGIALADAALARSEVGHDGVARVGRRRRFPGTVGWARTALTCPISSDQF